MRDLSPQALEVLGVLAPHTASGPHTESAVASRTRLNATAFAGAVAELCARGLLDAQARNLWVTPVGEEVLGRLFA